MKLIRYNDPFMALNDMHRQMDNIFGDLFSNQTGTLAAGSMDIYEEDGTLHAEVLVPGFTKDQVGVNIHEGVLEVKGEKHDKEENNDKKRTYMVRESSETFYRRVALPKNVDTDKLEAHYDDGVLKVTAPYKELPQPKKIDIKTKK